MSTVEVVWARVDGSADQADDLLRREVARYSGIEPALVRIGRLCGSCGSDRHGRPLVSLPEGVEGWHVSLSRSPDVLAVGFTRAGAVGIDVERADATGFAGFDGVALHPEESARTVRDKATIWVRKESLLKATGDGLDVDPCTVRLSGPAEKPALLAWTSPRPRPAYAQMADLQIDSAQVAAVTVLSGAALDLRTREAVPGVRPG